MLLWIQLPLFLLGLGFFAYRRLLRYLQFFQQEEYHGRRFLAWLWRTRAFDSRATIACAAALMFAAFCPGAISSFVYLAAGVLFAAVGLIERDPRREGKLRLKMTDRARRIYKLAFAFAGAALLAAIVLDYCLPGGRPLWRVWLLLAVAIQAMPLSVVFSNVCLLPAEKRRQEQFVAEARAILSHTRPTVIGITGSYGKTSTKTLLNEMLGIVEPTFTLGRSINTLMGITREIRERMKLGHRYAVIEMGAYQRGSITTLCALTPPQAGIITAVGVMHLERFGSPENVFLAKSELAEAIPPEGILVCNGDDEGARRIAQQHPKRLTLLYGFDQSRPLDCRMTDIAAMDGGTTFVVHWRGRQYPGSTPLCGRPMLSNIMAAFTMACALGHDPRVMLAVVASMEPVENRLQVKRLTVPRPALAPDDAAAGKVNIVELRDAYNSNPVGFAAALEELGRVKGKRKILVTPGMVELGSRQSAENEAIAARAASVCQMAIIVGTTNEQALRAGLRKGGLTEQQIRSFRTRDEAFQFLRRSHEEEDVVLIENDLPDLYEATARF